MPLMVILAFSFPTMEEKVAFKHKSLTKAPFNNAHHGPAVSRFLVSNRSPNGAGCLRGLPRLIKTHFENISGCPF